MNFADKLIQLRRQHGLSQEQLADRLGVTRQSVSKWESGSSVPELNKIIMISELYDISIDYLVKDSISQSATGNAESSDNQEILREKLDYIEGYLKREYEYVSKTTVFGLPLVCIRISNRHKFRPAKGIIAIGNAAIGVIAIGIFSLGVFSLGIASVGLFCLGAFALGGLTLGALSVGLIAIGAVAFGIVTVGSASIGIYAGGVAVYGKELAVGVAAIGKTAIGENVTGDATLLYYPGIPKETVRDFILSNHPGLFRPLLDFFSFLGTVIN